MSKTLTFIISIALTASFSSANVQPESTASLKEKILTLAKSYGGKGDPDQSKQKTFEALIEQLVKENPMPSVRERIPILAGTWKQVWGPYEYQKNDGSVDPKLGVNEIYQVVFADGYYYNVAPYYPDEDKSREQIGLLRGEFKLDAEDPIGLRVQFTNYPGVEPRPTGKNIWDLAAVAEVGQLENEITIVPTWIVKLFFGGGKLEEVYTDKEIRILYGSKGKKDSRRSLYIMSRVN